MNSTLNSAIRKVARNLSIDFNTAAAVYKSYWCFIRTHIEELPLREMDRDEFEAVTSNFNLPYLGKLYTNYSKIEKYRKRKKYYENAKDKKD